MVFVLSGLDNCPTREQRPTSVGLLLPVFLETTCSLCIPATVLIYVFLPEQQLF